MNYLQTIILGVVQGLTEFLPVSSSGHLAVFEKVLAVQKTSNFFEVLVHVGTMGAIIGVFYRDVGRLLRSFFVFIFGNAGKEDIKRFKMCLYIILALIPTGVIGFFVDKRYAELSGNLFAVGMMFIITAVALFLTREPGAEDESVRPAKKTNWLLGLIIGIAQGIATLPGISRSGATISAGIVGGMEKAEAVRFSFLSAIPAIGGAMLLKIVKILQGAEAVEFVGASIVGALAAGVVGYVCLRVLIKIVEKGKLWYFSFYAAAAGVITVVISFF